MAAAEEQPRLHQVIPDREESSGKGLAIHLLFPIGNFSLTLACHLSIIPVREEIMTIEDLASAIRKSRRDQKLRQDQLAAAANVGVRFIIDLEAAKPTAQLGKTLAVLRALGLTLSLVDDHGR